MEKYENLFVSYIASSIFLHFEHSYMEKAINKKKKKKKHTGLHKILHQLPKASNWPLVCVQISIFNTLPHRYLKIVNKEMDIIGWSLIKKIRGCSVK